MSAIALSELDRNAESHIDAAQRPRVASQRTQLRTKSAVLWTVQGLLAAIFLFAGGMKLVMPIATLAAQSHLPGGFMKFIGVAEVLGALGLILPGLVRIRPDLTPLAAPGLVIIMTGATVITLSGGSLAPALIPLVVGVLSSFVAYGRRQLVRPA